MKLGTLDTKKWLEPDFSWKIHFCPNLGISRFLKNVIILKTMQNFNYLVILILSSLSQTPLSAKILVLELSTKILLTNEIIGFLKV